MTADPRDTRRDWLDLLLFEPEPEAAAAALAAGIDGLIVDLELDGKRRRQEGADTEINDQQPSDLELGRGLGARLRYCRIEGPGLWTREQVEAVLGHAPTHVLLPMVETPEEVERLLAMVDGRAAVGILVETVAAVARAAELAALPIFGAFLGLNDLAIQRHSRHLFVALADGTVERVRAAFAGREFGFAGVTVLDGGHPVPVRLLLAELARLDATFSFLRRSFRRDRLGCDLAFEVGRLREVWRELRARDADAVERDHQALLAKIAEMG
jgi:hypothetical protein